MVCKTREREDVHLTERGLVLLSGRSWRLGNDHTAKAGHVLVAWREQESSVALRQCRGPGILGIGKPVHGVNPCHGLTLVQEEFCSRGFEVRDTPRKLQVRQHLFFSDL